jgi:CelD/BcsL family acetyltransferase involved in cellulose biosynthesis
MPPLRLEVYHAAEWPRVASTWSRLFQRSPYASFFLSPEWVESWLEVFAARLDPKILVFHGGDEAAGACLLVHRTERVGPFWVRRVYLNTAGEEEADSPCIECNNLLCLAGAERAVAAALRDHLLPSGWDELVLPGFAPGPPLKAMEEILPELDRVRSVRPCRYVDLESLRESGVAYGTALRQPTRKHVRQYTRCYEARGPLQVRVAGETREALEMLEELAALHQQAWNRRGRPGAFASPLFSAFHLALIGRGVSRGTVHLLRVTAGDDTVGLLYNFLHAGSVAFYQCGFRYADDRRLHPGMVALAQAITYYQCRGLREFDFLAGDGEYKRLLSTHQRELFWATFRRRSLKWRTIGTLRRAKRRLAVSV